MKRNTTQTLVEELVRELKPVRRLPRLRSMLALLLGGFGGVWALDIALQDAPPGAGAAAFSSDPAFLGVAVGLALVAAGALIAGLAGGVPGRSGLVRRAAIAAGVGALVLLVSGLAPLFTAGDAGAGTWALDLICGRHAVLLGLLSGALAGLFLARAATRHPFACAASAALGAFALGGFAVHLSCVAGGLHWLAGHALVPAALAVFAALPLAWLVRRTAHL